jgi:hypothetical protein
VRKLSVLVAASLLALFAVAVPVVVDALSGNDGSGQAVAAVDPDTEAGTDADVKADAGDAEGGGPPPWAHAGGKDKADKGAKHAEHAEHSKDSLDAWKSLTPAEREKLMTRLSKEHEAGMEAYQACRAEGRTDCVKPLPPGLAKRQAAKG